MFVFGQFGVLYFLETPVLRFALLSHYRHNVTFRLKKARKIQYFKLNEPFDLGNVSSLFQKQSILNNFSQGTYFK